MINVMAGIKRNLQEMYNLNGGADSNDSSANDAKKTRLDTRGAMKEEPSRVLHLRNIPHQLTETEIIHLGLSFGNVTNVLFLRSKNQAFLEFEHLGDAQQMVAHFNSSPVTFSGKKIFVQYSNHHELNTDPNNSNNQIAQATLDNAVQLHRSAKQGGKNTVLRATILNMIYPVTLDVLNQIFSKFGNVLKIITFSKNDKFQVLIQMKDAIAAQQAKTALHNQNIYNGCCTLQIDFSKLMTLEVRYNNDKSRDYTNLLLPTGDGMQNQSQSQVQGMNMQGDAQISPFGHHGQQQHHMQHQQQSLIGAAPGTMMQGGGGGMNQAPGQQMMHSGYGGMQAPQGQMGGGGQQNVMQQVQQQQQQHQQGQMVNNSPVLLVSNLNEELSSCDALFTLFGVYGDVQRVKILFNKKDSALIQFANAQQALTSLQNLDRVKVWGKQIRVFLSKHLTVQMPKDGQPDSGLTKDFSNSPLHRFKKPGSKNFNNIFPPSQTLHLSNIPPNVQETDLREIFSQYGTIRGFKFFQKDRKMALIQMDSVEEACHALVGTHNYQLAENMHLRCTFSKATI